MRGSEPSSGVMWYRNTPAGFDRRKLAGGFPRDVAVGDVDGDGDLDVVAAHDPYLQILRQGADHTFAEERVAGATSEVETGDVTGDGRTDIVAVNDRTVTVRAQTTEGGVGAPQVVDNNDIRAVGLDLGDIDGDGRTDATAIHDGGFWAEIYLQQAVGGLGAGEGRQVPQGSTGANGLAIGGANADGSPTSRMPTTTRPGGAALPVGHVPAARVGARLDARRGVARGVRRRRARAPTRARGRARLGHARHGVARARRRTHRRDAVV